VGGVSEKMTDEEFKNLSEIDRIGKLLCGGPARLEVLAAIARMQRCGEGDLPDVPLSERGFGT
jgi:hypothetical protein